LAATILFAPCAAWAQQPITLYIGQATANIGDTAEITVELGVGNNRPTAVVAWFKYDPAKLAPFTNFYEFIVRDIDGVPLRDSNNNTIVSTGAVRPEEVLTAAEKQIDVEIYPEGVIGVAILGINNVAIAPGRLLTIAFRVLPGAGESLPVAVEGVATGNPISIDNGPEDTASSASYIGQGGTTMLLPVAISNGRINVGCTPAPIPTGVTATQNQPNAVTVTWDAVNLALAEYRVFRATTNNVNNAQPLGIAWQSATTFDDVTALAAATPAGCACGAEPTVTRYFYWVKARTATQCEGGFSTPPVEGFRSAAKAASPAASVSFDTFPREASPASGDTLALRLASTNLDPATLWGEVATALGTSNAITFLPDGQGGGWATHTLPQGLPAGSQITFTAGSADSAGTPSGVQVRTFTVASETAKSAPTANLSVVGLGLDTVPYLPEGVGEPYTVGPDTVFADPATVYLPVPRGATAADLIPYVYNGVSGDDRWYLATNVTGLLAAAPSVETINGAPHVALRLNHGAIVQLGTPVGAPRPAGASVMPLGTTSRFAGDLLVATGMALVLLACAARRPATTKATPTR